MRNEAIVVCYMFSYQQMVLLFTRRASLSGGFPRRQLVHSSRFSSQKYLSPCWCVCAHTCTSATLARRSADVSKMLHPGEGGGKVREENTGSECQQLAGN